MAKRPLLAAVAVLTSLAVPANAQQAAIASWVSFDAPTGLEGRTTSRLPGALNNATGGECRGDELGNLVLRKGSGSPRRVVACAIDRPGFAVTQITADGFLRLHRVGRVAHPLWDQAHEGQQLEVLTEAGAVPAVAAIANGHFAQQHRRDSLVATADDLWVDVGATSRAEVVALGIRLLDPVQRRLPSWSYGDHVAGTAAGQRTGCAALVAAARGTVAQGETMFVLSVQGAFGWPGRGGVLARARDFTADTITLLMGGRAERTQRWARPGSLPSVNAAVFRAARVDSVRVQAPAVRHANTLVESLAMSEAAWLLSAASAAAGVRDVPADPWLALPVRARQSARAAAPPPAICTPPRWRCSPSWPISRGYRATNGGCARPFSRRFPNGPATARRSTRSATSS